MQIRISLYFISKNTHGWVRAWVKRMPIETMKNKNKIKIRYYTTHVNVSFKKENRIF